STAHDPKAKNGLDQAKRSSPATRSRCTLRGLRLAGDGSAHTARMDLVLCRPYPTACAAAGAITHTSTEPPSITTAWPVRCGLLIKNRKVLAISPASPILPAGKRRASES